MTRELWITGALGLGVALYGCGGQSSSGGGTGASSSGASTSSGGKSDTSDGDASGGRAAATGGSPSSSGGALSGGSSNGGTLSGGGSSNGGGAPASGGGSGAGGVPNSERTFCLTDSDCVVADKACCGTCEPVMLDQLEAVNRNWGAMRTCPEIVCAPCPPFEVDATQRKYFFASCVEQRCTLHDFRETELAGCDEDADCRLRTGLGCCETCRAEDLLAYSSLSGLAECGLVDCAACEPLPFPASAACNDETGRCEALWGIN